MISQAIPTGDEELDKKAWSKTQDELDRGIAFLVEDWDQLITMFGHDVVVAVRRAIWERHGNAIEWAVRVIDDFRAGLINDACSYCSVHRPATHDDVIAAIMAARQNHDNEQVKSWTSEFAKACRQVAHMIEQLHLTIVAQWCPRLNKSVFIISAGQLFGGKNTSPKFQQAPCMVVLLNGSHVWSSFATHC